MRSGESDIGRTSSMYTDEAQEYHVTSEIDDFWFCIVRLAIQSICEVWRHATLVALCSWWHHTCVEHTLLCSNAVDQAGSQTSQTSQFSESAGFPDFPGKDLVNNGLNVNARAGLDGWETFSPTKLHTICSLNPLTLFVHKCKGGATENGTLAIASPKMNNRLPNIVFAMRYGPSNVR